MRRRASDGDGSDQNAPAASAESPRGIPERMELKNGRPRWGHIGASTSCTCAWGDRGGSQRGEIYRTPVAEPCAKPENFSVCTKLADGPGLRSGLCVVRGRTRIRLLAASHELWQEADGRGGTGFDFA
jgi:hypothetical protein